MAGTGQMPDFFGDPMHVHGEAHATITYQGKSQFLLPHNDSDGLKIKRRQLRSVNVLVIAPRMAKAKKR
ncbi:MAG: hypothetical protein AAGK01_11105, partial [Pseudomonadota bacterium]